MTNDGLNTMTYTGESRVALSAQAGTTTTYTYDGNGLRVSKQVGSATPTVYVFSGTKVIAEYADGAAPASPTKEYIYSGSQLLATITGTTTNYHMNDHLSARVTTDSAGAIVGQQGHYPFGEDWYSSSSTTKFRFTTYERDGESGNDYAMFRTSVNRLARFSSPDPLAGSVADPQSLNRYAYVLNDPLRLIDPLGLTCFYVDGILAGCEADPEPSPFGPGGSDPVTGGFPGAGGGGGGGGSRPMHPPLWDDAPGGGGPGQKKKDLIKAALMEKNLAKCLNKFFGPGKILTNENLPRIDASKDLRGGAFGQTDARQVPDTGRGTVQIDRGIFKGLPANDPQLVGTYLHETANALAIQRFTNFPVRALRPRLGPLGGPPTEAQNRSLDRDIGEQFEKCIFEKK